MAKPDCSTQADELAVDIATYLENVEIMCALSDQAIIDIRNMCRKAFESVGEL